MHKTQIREAFNAAADTYDQYALIQHQAAMFLMNQVIMFAPKTSQMVLDHGCGTGWAWHELKRYFPEANILHLDIADHMLHQCPDEGIRICADMEHLPLPEQSLDIIFSNLSMQWSLNTEQMLKECYKVLKPGGQIHFSVLGTGTFEELYEKTQKPALLYPDAKQWRQELFDAGFRHIEIDEYTLTDDFDSFYSLIKHLKLVGAYYNPNFPKAEPNSNTYQALNDTKESITVSYKILQGIGYV